MNMQMSPNGIRLLKVWEGSRLKMYRDSAGLPTIGVGHLLTKTELISGMILIGGVRVPYVNGLTEAQVLQLLDKDNNTAETAVNTYVKVPLTQNQFDALVSFTFNAGDGALAHSTLLKRLNKGEYYAVPEELPKWCHAGGKTDKGLQQRREKEIKLWRGQI